MKIHEYQAKELFQGAAIPVQPGEVAATAEEAVAVATRIGAPVVVKAQVHVGGRGKAGGVKLCDSLEPVQETAAKILDLNIKGLPVRKVLITKAEEISREVYLSLLLDRAVSKPVFIGCAEGGVEIEETAKTNPEKILRHEIDSAELKELNRDRAKVFAAKLYPEAHHQDSLVDLMAKMARLFHDKDASLVEINPLILNGEDRMLALDAKVLLDDNALFRHPDLEAYRDMDTEDVDELDAKEAGLSFIRLEGSIGCMVNGAGLAMATMDIIKHFGGAPANFLDVGGSSDPKKVVLAFQKILKDPSVKCLFINIFGGITRCDDIAKGILQALESFEVKVPMVIRLVGTNEVEGRALLAGAKADITVAETLEAGAQRAVALGKGAAA